MPYRLAVLVTACILAINSLEAQDIFSPLSTQGIGQLRNRTFAHNQGMGSLGTAYTRRDSMAYSLKNPATSSYLKYTSIDMGIKLGLNEVVGQGEGNRGMFDDYGLNYLSLAFPLNPKKGWTLGTGIAPFTAYGYETYSMAPDSFTVEEHLFDGGVSEVYLNTAIRLWSNRESQKAALLQKSQTPADSTIRVPLAQVLSGGVQGSFLFGQKAYTHNLYFPTSTDLAAIQMKSDYIIRGFTYRVGLHYKLADIHFSGNKTTADGSKKKVEHYIDMEIGAYMGSSARNRARLEQYATSFFISGSGTSLADTSMPLTSINAPFKLPNAYGLGFMFTKMDIWKLGVDLDYTQWSRFELEGLPYKSYDELRTSLGGTYSPKNDNRFWQRLEYRAGASYWKSFLNQNDKQLRGVSTTFGIGMPFGKTVKSTVNLGAEIGTLGNRNINPFEERFYNLYLGFTINEFWFQTQKEK